MLNITDEISLRKKFCFADYLKHLSEDSPDYSSTIGMFYVRKIVGHCLEMDSSQIIFEKESKLLLMSNVFYVMYAIAPLFCQNYYRQHACMCSFTSLNNVVWAQHIRRTCHTVTYSVKLKCNYLYLLCLLKK